MLAADEAVVVVGVVESEAEETDVGDCGGSRKAELRAGCSPLWIIRMRVRVRASGVCTRFPWCAACLPVLVLSVVSCVVSGGVVVLSRLCG